MISCKASNEILYLTYNQTASITRDRFQGFRASCNAGALCKADSLRCEFHETRAHRRDVEGLRSGESVLFRGLPPSVFIPMDGRKARRWRLWRFPLLREFLFMVGVSERRERSPVEEEGKKRWRNMRFRQVTSLYHARMHTHVLIGYNDGGNEVCKRRQAEDSKVRTFRVHSASVGGGYTN